jgi:hypothetical protein
LIVIVFINFIKKQGIFFKKGLIFAMLAMAHFQQVAGPQSQANLPSQVIVSVLPLQD